MVLPALSFLSPCLELLHCDQSTKYNMMAEMMKHTSCFSWIRLNNSVSAGDLWPWSYNKCDSVPSARVAVSA